MQMMLQAKTVKWWHYQVNSQSVLHISFNHRTQRDHHRQTLVRSCVDRRSEHQVLVMVF